MIGTRRRNRFVEIDNHNRPHRWVAGLVQNFVQNVGCRCIEPNGASATSGDRGHQFAYQCVAIRSAVDDGNEQREALRHAEAVAECGEAVGHSARSVRLTYQQ